MTKTVGPSGVPRIAIADDSMLVYSDNWRKGWWSGFVGIGCDVQTFDISALRQLGMSGVYSTRGATRQKHVADAIAKWRPDLVWCYHGRAASTGLARELARLGIKTAVYLPDEPYETGESARFTPQFDFVFTMDHCTLQAHLESRELPRRRNVFYLPPCADTDLFQVTPYEHRDGAPALFLGNPELEPRAPWLRAVEAAVNGAQVMHWPIVVRGRKMPVAKGHPKWVSVDRHPELYSSCLVGLNIHRDPAITKECFRTRVLKRPAGMAVPKGLSLWKTPPERDGTGFWNDANLPASHINPRFFEMAACGTLVVSDNHRSELARLFPFAPRADNAQHFVELVRYFINHQDEAEEIGRKCSLLISNRHSYQHRACEVLIRAGLADRLPAKTSTLLAEQEAWLTPQDFNVLAGKSSSARTGPSGSWSPAYGLSLIRTSGHPSEATSLDAPLIIQPLL